MIKEIIVVSALVMTLLSVDGKAVARQSSDHEVPVTGNFEQDLEKYLEVYHPTYVRSLDENYEKRVKRFREVYDEILNHDPIASGYHLGFSHLSFKTDEELDAMKNKVMAKESMKAPEGIKHHIKTDVSALPASFSWVDKDKVTPVKYQGQCGSCYTYAAAAALETAIAIKCGLTNTQRNLQSVSTKQFIDCSYGYGYLTYRDTTGYTWDEWVTGSRYGNNGCEGGFPRACYAYMNMTTNVENEFSDYAYDPADKTVKNDKCAYDSHAKLKNAVPVVGYVVVPSDENAMMDALVNNGALACGMNANSILSYESGVFSGSCDLQANHAITIVGYGTDDTTKTPYWLIKNSWSTYWGEKGYLRLKRGSNQCGIASNCVYPILSGSCKVN